MFDFAITLGDTIPDAKNVNKILSQIRTVRENARKLFVNKMLPAIRKGENQVEIEFEHPFNSIVHTTEIAGLIELKKYLERKHYTVIFNTKYQIEQCIITYFGMVIKWGE